MTVETSQLRDLNSAEIEHRLIVGELPDDQQALARWPP